MQLNSMTGFARTEGGDDSYAWVWEVKSVNGKSCDVRCRLPSGFDRLEMQARKMASARVARGNINLALTIDRQASEPDIQINRALLDQLLALHAELGGKVSKEPPTIEGLLSIRGVLEFADAEESNEDIVARDQAMLSSLSEALDALATMRADEGKHLTAVISGLLDSIDDLTKQAAASAAAQPDALRARVQQLVSELLDNAKGLNEERLAQEAMLIVSKSDIREELDRLEAHLAAARKLVTGGDPVGRKLDFLCQELNREANTLCAKSADIELNQIGLELKAIVDQLREQVQNVE